VSIGTETSMDTFNKNLNEKIEVANEIFDFKIGDKYDYFKVLGLQRSASVTAENVKKAFYKVNSYKYI
jgi:hypothetical protein